MQLELWLNIYLLEKNYIKNNNTFGLNCWTYRKHKSNTKVGTNQSQPKMLYFFLPNIQTLPPSLVRYSETLYNNEENNILCFSE